MIEENEEMEGAEAGLMPMTPQMLQKIAVGEALEKRRLQVLEKLLDDMDPATAVDRLRDIVWRVYPSYMMMKRSEGLSPSESAMLHDLHLCLRGLADAMKWIDMHVKGGAGLEEGFGDDTEVFYLEGLLFGAPIVGNQDVAEIFGMSADGPPEDKKNLLEGMWGE